MQGSTYLLPVNTLIFRSEGLRVGIVRDGKVVLTTVTPGHDFGEDIEIVAGLKAGDQVIVNPPDSLISGQQVQIVQATLPGDANETPSKGFSSGRSGIAWLEVLSLYWRCCSVDAR